MTDKHSKTTSSEAEGEVGPVRLVSNYTSGGHELDITPTRNLMLFLLAMVVLMVVAAVGVYQLFVAHTESQMDEAASAPSSELMAHREREEALATSYGTVIREEQVVGFRVPYEEAMRQVLADPSRLDAAPPPEGWVHPDDTPKN